MAIPKLRALLFDIDDTLFSTASFTRAARTNAAEAMVNAGLRLPVDAVLSELEEVIREFTSNHGNHFDKLLTRLPPEATRGLNPALVVAAGIVAYHDTKFRGLQPFADVPPLLCRARDAGLRLGVITRGRTTKQAEKLIRLGLVSYFEPGAIFISDQVGISKPNPKLYAVALREMGVGAPEAMYIGDHLQNDILPASSVGMPTVWVIRGTRADQEIGPSSPAHRVRDFYALGALLKSEYGVPLADV